YIDRCAVGIFTGGVLLDIRPYTIQYLYNGFRAAIILFLLDRLQERLLIGRQLTDSIRVYALRLVAEEPDQWRLWGPDQAVHENGYDQRARVLVFVHKDKGVPGCHDL